MTNAEAIETLKANYPDACFKQLREAVDISINAMTSQAEKTQHSEEDTASDCISRKAAIDAVFELNAYHRVSWKDAVIDTIDALPPAQPEPHWIPCSERLPDQYGNYLISIDGEEPDIGTINPNDPRGWSLCDANGFYWASDKALNITAWMPLPEAFREGES